MRRRNRFHQFANLEILKGHTSVVAPGTGAQEHGALLFGIYLDDMESGWLIEDNHFERAGTMCVMIGGGRQNRVLNNTFTDCHVPVHVDDRGLGWMKCNATLTLNTSQPAQFIKELEDVFHYRQPPWSTAGFDPPIDVSLKPCAPALNQYCGNQYCARVPPPPPPIPGCARCPAGLFAYEASPHGAGSFCCTLKPTANSCPHPGKICCLTPGKIKKTPYGDQGCEGFGRCDNNPANKTACLPVVDPSMPFTDLHDKPEWKNVFTDNVQTKSCL